MSDYCEANNDMEHTVGNHVFSNNKVLYHSLS